MILFVFETLLKLFDTKIMCIFFYYFEFFETFV